MKDWLRLYLVEAAGRELAARERGYPGMIKTGKVERGDAAADLLAWRAIVLLFENKRIMEAEAAELDPPAGAGISWAALELATSRALIRRSAAVEAKPRDQDLVMRRDAVQALHDRISWHRHFHSGGRLALAPEARRAA